MNLDQQWGKLIPRACEIGARGSIKHAMRQGATRGGKTHRLRCRQVLVVPLKLGRLAKHFHLLRSHVDLHDRCCLLRRATYEIPVLTAYMNIAYAGVWCLYFRKVPGGYVQLGQSPNAISRVGTEDELGVDEVEAALSQPPHRVSEFSFDLGDALNLAFSPTVDVPPSARPVADKVQHAIA